MGLSLGEVGADFYRFFLERYPKYFTQVILYYRVDEVSKHDTQKVYNNSVQKVASLL
jgi:hypothetical protein